MAADLFMFTLATLKRVNDDVKALGFKLGSNNCLLLITWWVAHTLMLMYAPPTKTV
jgi:hypothetical protein